MYVFVTRSPFKMQLIPTFSPAGATLTPATVVIVPEPANFHNTPVDSVTEFAAIEELRVTALRVTGWFTTAKPSTWGGTTIACAQAACAMQVREIAAK